MYKVKFQQKVLNSVVVGAHQSFQFFKQITWFLRNNAALSKFRYQILYYLINQVIIKSVGESQFYINYVSHLESFAKFTGKYL